ncbi:hypothetical protein GMOD_00006101 [Pyrenophora seminiperda CCB06]|uniref:Uncharacterized protein n=1 Tax=Pyrenophora seminiperda CCB06 TaxID=1302712 RepID=A0A3M7M495_9PLEO|nr:hypothetical protein GMOD_00006101 [Pyrenophora seminiperda CCB06]
MIPSLVPGIQLVLLYQLLDTNLPSPDIFLDRRLHLLLCEACFATWLPSVEVVSTPVDSGFFVWRVVVDVVKWILWNTDKILEILDRVRLDLGGFGDGRSGRRRCSR